MELERTGDRQQDLICNALRVLAVIQQWISETPEQWLMYYPVWPGDEDQ
jgi:lauroyl/myristoyl acyltransferase